MSLVVEDRPLGWVRDEIRRLLTVDRLDWTDYELEHYIALLTVETRMLAERVSVV